MKAGIAGIVAAIKASDYYIEAVLGGAVRAIGGNPASRGCEGRGRMRQSRAVPAPWRMLKFWSAIF